MKKLWTTALILTLTVFATVAVYAASVTLAWNPSPDASVTGYRIYWGPSSGVYTNSVAVGNVSLTTLSGLRTNTFYVFAATAYDASGVESDFSNEVGYTTPNTGGGGTNAPVKPKPVTNLRRIQP